MIRFYLVSQPDLYSKLKSLFLYDLFTEVKFTFELIRYESRAN